MVHVMDENTRKALRLEYLWSGEDPLWTLDVMDDDAVENYVAKNPVPPSYGPNPGVDYFGEGGWTGSIPVDVGSIGRQLQRQAFAAAHRPVVPAEDRRRTSREAKRRRREELERGKR